MLSRGGGANWFCSSSSETEEAMLTLVDANNTSKAALEDERYIRVFSGFRAVPRRPAEKGVADKVARLRHGRLLGGERWTCRAPTASERRLLCQRHSLLYGLFVPLPKGVRFDLKVVVAHGRILELRREREPEAGKRWMSGLSPYLVPTLNVTIDRAGKPVHRRLVK